MSISSVNDQTIIDSRNLSTNEQVSSWEGRIVTCNQIIENFYLDQIFYPIFTSSFMEGPRHFGLIFSRYLQDAAPRCVTGFNNFMHNYGIVAGIALIASLGVIRAIFFSVMHH